MNEEFNLSTLGELDDGYARRLIDRAIAKAVDDIGDRPGVPKARRVTVHIDLVPNTADSGHLTGVLATVHVPPVKVPGQKVEHQYLPTSAVGDHTRAYLPGDAPTKLFPSTPATDN